jgi:hypothetical protein
MHWLGFVGAIVAAEVFYWLRDQHRVLYGTTEIVVGLAILLVVFDIIPTPIILTADCVFRSNVITDSGGR